MKAVLFDIDGTLLDASGAGAKAFGAAFEPIFGWIPDLGALFAGGTDLDIFRRILNERGIESNAELESSYFESLAKFLDEALTEKPPRVLAGVSELLTRIADMSDFSLGIVTGNIEATAWLKLKHAGLRDFFSFGGFGCDHPNRSIICAEALKRGGILKVFFWRYA